MGARDCKEAADLCGTLFIPIVFHPGGAEDMVQRWIRERGVGNTELTDPEVLETIRLEEDVYAFGGSNVLTLAG